MTERVARYHRVSTREQNLERQAEATHEYIERHFPDAKVLTYTDASTGTDTEREGYQNLMVVVEDSGVDAVVVKDLSRISRSIRDLDATVERLRDNGVAFHTIDEGLVLEPGEDPDPMQRAMWQLLGVFAELEARMTRQRIKEGIAAKGDHYHHGPPPLGFEKRDGELYPADNYDQVVTVLEMVAKGNMSQRQAAKELGCGRKTIRRAVDDKSSLYGLD